MEGQSHPRWPVWGALAASFAVYLLPIVGPHGWWFFGVALTQGFEGEIGWNALNFAVAAAVQAAAFGLFYWAFRGVVWQRVLLLVPLGVLIFVGIQWAYLIAIPSAFLIEDDTAPELTTWEEHCALPEHWLVKHIRADRRGIAQAGEAWVGWGDSQLGLLRMPECTVEPQNLVRGKFTVDRDYVVPRGGLIYSLRAHKTRERTLFVRPTPDAEPRALVPPPDTGYPKPVLSSDGAWIGWLQRAKWVKGEPGNVQVQLEQWETGEVRIVPLAHMMPARFDLMKIDPEGGTVMLSRHSRLPEEFLSVNLEGEIVWGPVQPTTVGASSRSFRKVDGGFVAWDSYLETKAYRIEWSLPGGSGLYRIPLGRGITSLAVSPDGRYIAVSVNTNLNIGDIDDSVFVIRASDGAEVFRRYLKVYTRSAVAFLGDGFFAYMESRDSSDGLRVLKIPPSGS